MNEAILLVTTRFTMQSWARFMRCLAYLILCPTRLVCSGKDFQPLSKEFEVNKNLPLHDLFDRSPPTNKLLQEY